jgi:hypothetical protein
MKLSPSLALLTAVVLAWCVALPFVWAHSIGDLVHISFVEALRLYVPELVVGAVVVFGLALAFVNGRLAIGTLLVAGFLAPALKFAVGSASSGIWPVTSVLLALLCWRLYASIKPSANLTDGTLPLAELPRYCAASSDRRKRG